jgi:hypothetical protein
MFLMAIGLVKFEMRDAWNSELTIVWHDVSGVVGNYRW